MITLSALFIFLFTHCIHSSQTALKHLPEHISFQIQEKKPALEIINSLNELFSSNSNEQEIRTEILQNAALHGHAELIDLLYDSSTHRSTPLIHYAAAGNQELVIDHLIKRYQIDPFTPDADSNFPHHYAAQNGAIEAYRTLLNHQTQPKKNLSNITKQTPMHWACKAGFLKLLKIMIEEERQDPNQSDINNNNALHYAAMAEPKTSDELLCYLLERIRVTTINNKRENPLHLAARGGNIAIVKALLKEHDKLKSDRTVYGAIPALYAAQGGDFDIYQLLRYQKKQGNEPDWHGRGALHYAASAGQATFLQNYLVKFKKLVLSEHMSKKGLTPLHEAISACSITSINELMQKSSLDKTEMHEYIIFACEHSTLAVVKELIEIHQFTVLPENDELDNPLNRALKYKKNDIALYLFQQPIRNLNKDYLLHRAIYFDNYDIALWALQNNPLLIESDYYGYSPLLWAVACQNIPISKMLLQSGAQVKKLTTTCQNALHIAFANNNLELVQWLLSTKQFTMHDMFALSHELITPLDLLDATNKELVTYIAHCIWKSNGFKCSGCHYRCEDLPNELYTKCGHLLCIICQTNSESCGYCYACAQTRMS